MSDGAWHWLCPTCDLLLLWARDTVAGRALINVLALDTGRTAEQLMEEGRLRFWAHEVDRVCLVCRCEMSLLPEKPTPPRPHASKASY